VPGCPVLRSLMLAMSLNSRSHEHRNLQPFMGW